MIKCGFCGLEFDKSSAGKCCGNCPMSGNCRKSKCPNCGFEIMSEPSLITLIKRKWGKGDA